METIKKTIVNIKGEEIGKIEYERGRDENGNMYTKIMKQELFYS